MLELNKNFELKKSSLSLFRKQVLINLRPGSVTFEKFGATIHGKIIQRIWGEWTSSEEKSLETVIAIAILNSRNQEVLIPCADILMISEMEQ